MKLCSMKLESCIKINRVAHLKTLFYETVMIWNSFKNQGCGGGRNLVFDYLIHSNLHQQSQLCFFLHENIMDLRLEKVKVV